MVHRDRIAQRREAGRALGKIERLYRFFRGLGLHYKVSENFGCSVITIGRNSHPFSEIYEEFCNPPASVENEADISDKVLEENKADIPDKVLKLKTTEDGRIAKIKELEDRLKGSSDKIRNLKEENLNLVDELKKVNL